MIIFNYSFFGQKYFHAYEDYEGDQYDINYELSKNKQAIGGIVKPGVVYNYKKFRIDFYFGIGYRSIFINETVHKKLNWREELIPDNYPIEEHSFERMPTIHLGILIGLSFK